MPPIETAHRPQKALLWSVQGVNDRGNPTVDRGNPTELDVWWATGRTEALDPQGNTVAIDAAVVVDRHVPVGSAMWLGSEAEWLGSGTGSAGEATEVMQVVTYNEAPDLKGRNYRRVVGLIRYGDSLPPQSV